MKLRSVVPEEGVVVPHIRTGEPVALSRRVLAVFVLMTVADLSDQYTDYQDKLFRNDDGRLEFAGDNWTALWPGTGKPGLWMSAMSRLAALYRLIATDEQLRHMEDGTPANRSRRGTCTGRRSAATARKVWSRCCGGASRRTRTWGSRGWCWLRCC